jgi:protein-S-isoprenylcysteine O-methyltransferase Ste14
MNAFKQLHAILLLPGAAIVVIPGLLLFYSAKMNQPGWSLPLSWRLVLGLGSLLLIGCGLTLMVKTVKLFATIGQGTLAPWDPPQKLVVRGIYRHVRNPMISGVFCILLGEALLFGSSLLLGWFLCFVLVNFIYMPVVEEPMLAQRFGQDYIIYKQNVPRWIPRSSPWSAPVE